MLICENLHNQLCTRGEDEPDQGEDQVTVHHQDNDDNLTLGAEGLYYDIHCFVLKKIVLLLI